MCILVTHIKLINYKFKLRKRKLTQITQDFAGRMRIGSASLTLFLLRFACWEAVTLLRHGGSCPVAVCPLARPALAEAQLWKLGNQSRCCCTDSSPSPARVLRRRQPEDAVACPEPGEPFNRRGLALKL